MSKYCEPAIEDDYRAEFCPQCLYFSVCKRGLYPKYDEVTEVTTLKCEYFERRPTDEELRQIYSGEDYQEHS